jgi:multiple sugar transport system substrate-binding protein
MANAVRKNGDPKAQLDACEKKVDAELKKLFG